MTGSSRGWGGRRFPAPARGLGAPKVATEEPVERVRRDPVVPRLAILAALAWSAACGDGTGPANRAPAAVGTIPAQEIEFGESAAVDMSQYFSDPDGDALTYQASSSNAAVVTASTSGSTVTITAVGKGSVTVTVTASDPDGLSAQQNFAVTVPNRPPAAVGTVPAQEFSLGVSGGDASVTVDASAYFNDPDGDTLRYEASSSDDAVAAATVSGSQVDVAGRGSGTATVTLTAKDPENLSAEQIFRVTVEVSGEWIALKALYDATGGRNWSENRHWLSGAPMDDWYGVSVDSGTIAGLNLDDNGLAGRIPAALGELAGLRVLKLFDNALRGPIPPELGGLANLRELRLDGNSLTGPIPAELSQLAALRRLRLDDNVLTGSIPAELGELATLRDLDLGDNRLEGALPPELGELTDLRTLRVDRNRLAGSIPAEFGGMTALLQMVLTDNPELSGPLPNSLTSLTKLALLLAGGTDLCASSDPRFREWLAGVSHSRLALSCGDAAAYLTQAVQSIKYPVPLVAGEKALLRVFVTSMAETEEGIPPVRATFYLNGSQTHTEEIAAQPTAIPTEVEEGDISKSANAEIPGWFVQPGLEMVIEVDPDSTLAAELGVARRIPETGRLAVEVGRMPSFDLTSIPFLWESDPDSAILEIIDDMEEKPAEDGMLAATRTLLPIAQIQVTAYQPVVSSSNNALSLLRQTDAIRAMEGGAGYYMGMMSGSVRGAAGIAYLNGRSSFSIPDSLVVAHELGHNLTLRHAPCGNADSPDPLFPQTNGSIGSWGYDFVRKRLVSPRTRDLMSYCFPSWISEYYFTRAFQHRSRGRGEASRGGASQTDDAPPVQSILLWGGLDAEGRPFLEPAFVTAAAPALPPSGGQYRVTGESASGGELFSLSFDMPAVADAAGRSSLFAFTLPSRSEWAGTLVRITLSGPGGSATLDGNGERLMAIFRDPRTGRVRAFLRDLPPDARADVSARARSLGLDALLSRGVPDSAAWRR